MIAEPTGTKGIGLALTSAGPLSRAAWEALFAPAISYYNGGMSSFSLSRSLALVQDLSSRDRCFLLLRGHIASVVSMRTMNPFVSVQTARASHLSRSTLSCLLLGKRMH
jgi:hypothetical protein